MLTIEASEALPLLLFIGIGAMIDFGPLLSTPKMFLFGAADGPTSILVSQVLHSNYIGPIAVAAYSYMALVPIIQPFAIKLVTTKKDRAMHMPYNPKHVSRSLRINVPFEQAKKDALPYQAMHPKQKAAGCHFTGPIALRLRLSTDLPSIQRYRSHMRKHIFIISLHFMRKSFVLQDDLRMIQV